MHSLYHSVWKNENAFVIIYLMELKLECFV